MQKLIAIGLLILGISGQALAVQIDPFTAVVRVPDRSEAARIAGFRAALNKALVKYTGREAVADQLEVRSLERLIQLYTYQDDETSSGTGIALEVRFQESSIRDLVRQSGLPVWPLERGSTLAWIVLENGGDRTLLTRAGFDERWLTFFFEQASDRGVPMIEPLFDLEDQASISTADVWGGFVDQVREASERYSPDYILLGRLSSASEGWRGRWILDTGTELITWSMLDGSLNAALTSGVSGTAERLAERFAVDISQMGASDDGLEIYVTGLVGPEDFAAVTDHLQRLSVVNGLSLKSIDPIGVVFAASVDGGRASLEQVLEFDTRFSPGVSTVDGRITLVYERN